MATVLKGMFNEAKVFTDNIDETSRTQIIKLLDQEAFQGHKIRIMPDLHAGAGCVIGLSMELKDKVVPNLVGVDIGCGVLTLKLKERTISMEKLDEVIKKVIPSGKQVHNRLDPRLKRLADQIGVHHVKAKVNHERAIKSIGTLGGGNHFIEVGQAKDHSLYLFIHTGSRHFGFQIANYYQNMAQNQHKDLPKGQKDLSYLTGRDMKDYLHDMSIAQTYAAKNRETIAEALISAMGLDVIERFDTVHNYIDFTDNIIRKGAVPARSGQQLVVPLNMKDGVILAVGKGNSDWNQTAPHGAGRLYSRKDAKERLSLSDFKKTMEGVYTTSVSKKTLDEAPAAYKNMREIIDNTKDTMEIIDMIKPVYSFKA